MENTYDRKEFFEKYSQMERSVKGLEGAGEWHELQKLLPDFSGKRVLDLGCGFGWHCRYAVEKGLKTVNDEGLLRSTIEKVAADNPQSVADYQKGKEKAMGFLVGQTMKAMKGKADPAMVNAILKEIL